MASPISEKLQKVVAQTGLGSRRKIETYIAAGRFSINGKTAQIGARVTKDDKIYFDGKLVTRPSAHQTKLLMYHKPIGEICTQSDPEGRKTVFEALPKNTQRWISVGRLDINTAGLLLFTNDGELANHMMHPSANLEREYIVKIQGQVNSKIMDSLRTGIVLTDGLASFKNIEYVNGNDKGTHLIITTEEGRNRIVRRLFEAVNCQVIRLKRIRFGEFVLPSTLRPGRWELTYTKSDYNSGYNK